MIPITISGAGQCLHLPHVASLTSIRLIEGSLALSVADAQWIAISVDQRWCLAFSCESGAMIAFENETDATMFRIRAQ